MGNGGNHSEYSFGVNDELGNAHLRVARCDKIRPEDRHHIPCRNIVLPDELGAEPEAHDELSQRGELPRSSV